MNYPKSSKGTLYHPRFEQDARRAGFLGRPSAQPSHGIVVIGLVAPIDAADHAADGVEPFRPPAAATTAF